ncbi:MAG: hypothetical protein ACK6A8_02785 [Planctomycetota bacterium]
MNRAFALPCSHRLTLAFLLLLGLSGALANSAAAQFKRLPFGGKNQPATPAKEDYTLQQNSGPWLIMCASFAGEDGETQARMLCEELSQKHRLKCYLHRQEFDFSQTYTGLDYDKNQAVDENGNVTVQRRKMKAAHDNKFDEIAVLVGDFPTIEDSRAQQALNQIKRMQPETLGQLHSGEASSQRMRVWREAARLMNPKGEIKDLGPMRMAFLIPNPILPEEYFAAPKIDKFMIGVNRQAKHSLLECPGAYSVKVATFRGDITFDLNKIQEQEAAQRNRFGGGATGSKLMEAAEKAHTMAEELRRLGVQAYEFHDRHESYVCVGSFDWASKKDGEGNITHNPDVGKTIDMFRGDKEDLPNQPNAVVPRSIPKLRKLGIVFDIQPVPVLVPKAEETQTMWRK